MAKELWQAFSEDGKPIVDKGYTKDEAMSGKLHGASHVWIWRKQKSGLKVLLQKRAEDKRTWPGYYDISAAGHIDLGETPLQAALRETKEEIDLALKSSDLGEPFVKKTRMQVDNDPGLIEYEYRWVYTVEARDSLNINQKNDEVEELKWVSLDVLRGMIDKKLEDKLVPQGADYFSELLEVLASHENN